MKRALLVGSVMFVFALARVAAITYGVPDGNRHPNVGALVGEYSGGLYPYCSGTLISPTVFLTAAHCGGSDRVAITFTSDFDGSVKLLYGTFVADPLYTWKQGDVHDLAVVVLDRPVRGIAPAALPTLGQLDSLDQSSQFTAVGYGGDEIIIQAGGPVFPYYDERQYATSTFNALNGGFLRLSQNPATGDGGTCYGDSGGPNFIGAGATETPVIAGITVTGDALCRATNVTYRLDTDAARTFLGRFVALP